MSPATLLIVIAAVSGLALAWRYPRQAVWFLVLWIPVQGWVQLNVFNDSSATVLIYEFLIIGLVLIFAGRSMRSGAAFGLPGVIYVAVPFVVWTLLMVPVSLLTNGWLLTVLGLRTYLLPLPLVWIGYRAFESRRQLENVCSILMLQMAPIALLTVAQAAGMMTAGTRFIGQLPRGFGESGGIVRPPGTFSSDGHLGMYLLFAILIALGLLGLRASISRRAAFAIGLAGGTVALMANTQRATIVLLAIAVPFIIVLARRPHAIMKTVAAFVLVAAAGLIGNQLVGRVFAERVQSIRGDMYLVLVENPGARMRDALRTPVTGGGLGIASPGATRLDPGPALGRAPNDVPRGSLKSNESFMAALVYQLGVPGLLMFYLFIGALLRDGFRAVRALRASDIAVLAAAILSYQVAIVLQSWGYDPLHFPPSRVLFWFWAGVLLSLPSLAAAAPVHHRLPLRQMPPPRRLVRTPVPSSARRSTG